jgi:hypothetical protein
MIEYFISVDEMFEQDERVMSRLKMLILEHVYYKAEELDAKIDTRYPPMFTTSGPVRAYDEDGHPIGNHVMLSVYLTEIVEDE